jgi:hypothetical protein
MMINPTTGRKLCLTSMILLGLHTNANEKQNLKILLDWLRSEGESDGHADNVMGWYPLRYD